MTPARQPPTDDQLRDAYRRAGLASLGITYDQALADPALRGSLECMANSDRRWAATTLGRGSQRLEHIIKEQP